MILVTVGTYPLQFDRLLVAVDEAINAGRIKEGVFAQTGVSLYQPRYMGHASMLDKDAFDGYFTEASAIIAHAGMGTISMALDRGTPILVFPREKRYKEHVNDHQVATAREFERLGHVLAAYDKQELLEKCQQLKSFEPKPRQDQAEQVAKRIASFLDDCV
jgi:UDP-N-acetylglucosamine transferase subunit ALG13